MTAEDKASLKAWAENWYEGIFLVQGRQVLELLAENEQLERIADQRGREVLSLKALNEGLADRVAAQSELLSKRAERRKDNDDTKGDNRREHDINDVAHELYRSEF